VFDFRPRQLALTITLRRVVASDLGQIMGSSDSLGVATQHFRRQQQRGSVQWVIEGCSRQIGHQRNSKAARNVSALYTGVVVKMTIPNLDINRCPKREAAKINWRWSGGPVYIP
jgi:hypothetical protein